MEANIKRPLRDWEKRNLALPNWNLPSSKSRKEDAEARMMLQRAVKKGKFRGGRNV